MRGTLEQFTGFRKYRFSSGKAGTAISDQGSAFRIQRLPAGQRRLQFYFGHVFDKQLIRLDLTGNVARMHVIPL
jgi:hypothetical protein